MAKSIAERVAENLAAGGKKKKNKGEGLSAAKAKSKAPKEKKEKAPTNEVGQKLGTIMAEIYTALDSKKGASVKEIVEILKGKFPDRDPEGMERTVKIQIQRMPKEKGFRLDRDKETHRYKIVEKGLEKQKNGLKKAEKEEEKKEKVKKKVKKAKKVVKEVLEEEED